MSKMAAEKRRVSLAPGTKVQDETDTKSSKSKSSRTTGSLSKELNPIQRSTDNIKRSRDLRRTRGNYSDKIKNIEDEHEHDVRDLLEKINYYRKDNEKLLRQQTMKFGRTLDDMAGVKDALELARRTNDELFHEVEARKEESDKLQTEMESLLERINELTLEKSDLLHEKRIFNDETVLLEKTDNKVQSLIKSNRAMRSLLLHNKIDPNTDASTLAPAKVKIPSPHLNKIKMFSPHTKKVKIPPPPTARKFPDFADDPNTPIIFNRKNLLSFRSMEDVRPPEPKVKQGTIRRSHSYSQQPPGIRINSQKFTGRRLSDSLSRTHRNNIELFV